jgi:hypothetical protein
MIEGMFGSWAVVALANIPFVHDGENLQWRLCIRTLTWGMQLMAGIDDTKPSGMMAVDDMTQQNILFIEQIKFI